MAGLFLIAGGNSAKVLQFAEHAFGDMAFFVHVLVTASLHFAVGLGRYHRRDVTLSEPIEQGIGVIPFIGQQCACTDVLHEGHGLGNVCCLLSRQNKAHEKAQRIGQCVYLATKTAPRMAQRLRTRKAPGRFRCTGVRPYYCAVDADILHVCVDRNPGQHLLPHAKPAPTGKTLEHAV